MRSDYTEIVLVLDRSGSMANIWNDVIGGLKTLIENQKKVDGKCLFTLFVFDTEFDYIHNAVPIAEVTGIPDHIKPRGGTALVEAMIKGFESLETRITNMYEVDRPARVIFIVQTDGQENSSNQAGGYTFEKISKLIAYHDKRHAYQFMFLGANMDVIAEASKLSIPVASSVKWSNTPIGTDNLYKGLSEKMSSFRVGACSSMALTPEEKTNMENDKPIISSSSS